MEVQPGAVPFDANIRGPQQGADGREIWKESDGLKRVERVSFWERMKTAATNLAERMTTISRGVVEKAGTLAESAKKWGAEHVMKPARETITWIQETPLRMATNEVKEAEQAKVVLEQTTDAAAGGEVPLMEQRSRVQTRLEEATARRDRIKEVRAEAASKAEARKAAAAGKISLGERLRAAFRAFGAPASATS